MAETNCRYCNRTTDLAEIVADLEVSTLYLTKDQTYKGRCILAFKDHKKELFELTSQELQAYSRDMAKASKALYDTFAPGKINYAAFGDTYPHLHFHLVPKYEDGKSWGVPFELPLSPDKTLPEAEFDARIKEIKSRL